MLYETIIAPFNVSILIEGENRPCMLSIRHELLKTNLIEDVFPNARMLSAQFRDQVGLSLAIDMLNAMCVSPNSDLWDLNHSRPYERLVPSSRTDWYNDDTIKPSDEYDLLAETGWCGYEAGANYYLYQHRETMQLFVGASHSPDCGNEPYDDELEPMSMTKWAELVIECDSYDAG